MSIYHQLRIDSVRSSPTSEAEMEKLGSYNTLNAYMIKRAVDDLASNDIMIAVSALLFFVYSDEESLFLTSLTKLQFAKRCIMAKMKPIREKYEMIGVDDVLSECLENMTNKQADKFFDILREEIVKTIKKAHQVAKQV